MTRNSAPNPSIWSLWLKILLRVSPLVLVVLFVAHFEWGMWKRDVRRRLILDVPAGACSQDDVVCRQCPFFRETVGQMLRCVRKSPDASRLSADAGVVINGIPAAVSKCTVEWTKQHPIVQLIHERGTQLVIPANPRRAPMNVLVIGNDPQFEVEKQLAENATNVRFFGLGIDDRRAAGVFTRRLNGTLLNPSSLSNSTSGKYDLNLMSVGRTHFPRRPVDLVFVHGTNWTRSLVEKLMGEHEKGLPLPACQFNVDLVLPPTLAAARDAHRWFRRLATRSTPVERQFVVGFATTAFQATSVHLRFFVVNVGHPTCIARFLERECPPLIGSIHDE
ncbi:hypothetical protein M3Y99_01170200 [Aphelenchoides fujianensis]|nr:hypothetical protein M3Y99_01170200 [Aphelenchoides fujianensis]